MPGAKTKCCCRQNEMKSRSIQYLVGNLGRTGSTAGTCISWSSYGSRWAAVVGSNTPEKGEKHAHNEIRPQFMCETWALGYCSY